MHSKAKTTIKLPPAFVPAHRTDLSPGYIPVDGAVFRRYASGEKTWEIRQKGPRWTEDIYPAGRKVLVGNGRNPNNGTVPRLVARLVDAPDYWCLPEEVDEGAVIELATKEARGREGVDFDMPITAIELLPFPKKPDAPADAKDIKVNMTASSVLRRAGDLLERGWVRKSGVMAEDAHARPVEPIAKSAVRWSINGAIERASYELLNDPARERYAPGRIEAWQRAHASVCHILHYPNTLRWERSPERAEEEWRDVLAAAQVYAEDMERAAETGPRNA